MQRTAIRGGNTVVWDVDMIENDVPEFYSDTIGRMELAGDGNIRCYRCVLRMNRIVPVYSVVSPIRDWLSFPNTFGEVAARLARSRQSALMDH